MPETVQEDNKEEDEEVNLPIKRRFVANMEAAVPVLGNARQQRVREVLNAQAPQLPGRTEEEAEPRLDFPEVQ